MACHIYLIPLLKYPVFKIGFANDVNVRMKGCGILRHADKKRIVIVRFPDKKMATVFEDSFKKYLHIHRTDNIPDDIKNGRTEFFTNNAWQPALTLVSNLRDQGVSYDVVKWARSERVKRLPTAKKPVNAATLRKRLQIRRKIDVAERYNRLVFSNYWIRLLESAAAASFLGLRYTKDVSELRGYYQEAQECIEAIYSDANIPEDMKVLLVESYRPPASEKWVLVYDDPAANIFNEMTAKYKKLDNGRYIQLPTVKSGSFGSGYLVDGSYNVEGITVIEVDPNVFKVAGTERLLNTLQNYNANFPIVEGVLVS